MEERQREYGEVTGEPGEALQDVVSADGAGAVSAVDPAGGGDLREGPDSANPLPAETQNAVADLAATIGEIAQNDDNVATQDVVEPSEAFVVCPTCGTAGEVDAAAAANGVRCLSCGTDFRPDDKPAEVPTGVLGAEQARGSMCESIDD